MRTILFVAALQAAAFGGSALPIAFVPNVGQVDSEIRYFVQTPDLRAVFAPRSVTFQIGGDELLLRFVGANANPTVEGRGRQSGSANFFLGNHSFTDLPLYGEIVYRQLYPYIDMVYSAQGNRAKSEFFVEPGGDPEKIVLDYPGATLTVANDGALIVQNGRVTLRDDAPLIYQSAATAPAFRWRDAIASVPLGKRGSRLTARTRHFRW